MTDFVKQLKEQISIAEVVGEFVRLKKSGSNHMGLCPFHAERSPSFSVSEKRGIYHCFGCQRGGDAISFIQEIQGVSFHESVRILASKFNLKLPPEFANRTSSGKGGQQSEDKLEIYHKLNRFVAQFYHEKLLSPEGEVARAYLSRRGITAETIKKAYLGYAPAAWADLYDFLAAKKAPLDKAEELGLIRKKGNGADVGGRAHYDLFRDRVMFPVTDARGRVIAFGGRALGDTEGPKYLNSSESPIYKKGSHLFGLFQAQKDIRAEDLCVLVEGFMDCISLQQADIGYAVATLGTALTERQVGMIKRFTKNIVVLFDGDSAGQEAQARAMEIFLNEDVVVKGVALPEGMDPDDFVQAHGAETLTSLLRNAPHLLDQRILDLASKAGAHTESRARAVDQILPWIAKINSETAQMVRLQDVAGLFGVDFEMLERRVRELGGNKAPVSTKPLPAAATSGFTDRRNQNQYQQGQRQWRPYSTGNAVPVPPPVHTKPTVDPLDVRLIELFIAQPGIEKEFTDREAVIAGLESEATRELVTKLWGCSATGINAEVIEWTNAPALKAVLIKGLVAGENTTKIYAESAEGTDEKESEKNAEEREHLLQEVFDLEKKIVRRGLEHRKDQLRAIILKADSSGKSEEFSKLMNEYNELVKRLDETKGGQLNL